MKKSKNTRIRTIIVLVILFVLLICIVAAGFFVYKNHNSIMAVYYMYTNKLGDLEQNKLQTDEKALEAIKDYGIETVRPLSDEEAERLNAGELTEEEAVDLILGRGEETESTETEETGASAENTENTAPSTSPTPAESEEISAKKEEIAQLIAQMYVLKAKFSDDLKAIEDWVNSEYRFYCDEYGGSENIPYSVKAKVGKLAYSKALALETECDNKVNGILSRLTTLLQETGQSTNIVSEIKAAYDNEKMLAKSYYMDQI